MGLFSLTVTPDKIKKMKDQKNVMALIKVIRKEDGKLKSLGFAALVSIGKQSIDPLIQLLDDEDSVIRNKVEAALNLITRNKLDFGSDSSRWQQWWMDSKDNIPDFNSQLGETIFERMLLSYDQIE